MCNFPYVAVLVFISHTFIYILPVWIHWETWCFLERGIIRFPCWLPIGQRHLIHQYTNEDVAASGPLNQQGSSYAVLPCGVTSSSALQVTQSQPGSQAPRHVNQIDASKSLVNKTMKKNTKKSMQYQEPCRYVHCGLFFSPVFIYWHHRQSAFQPPCQLLCYPPLFFLFPSKHPCFNPGI